LTQKKEHTKILIVVSNNDEQAPLTTFLLATQFRACIYSSLSPIIRIVEIESIILNENIVT
jgi:hypothetical protein